MELLFLRNCLSKPRMLSCNTIFSPVIQTKEKVVEKYSVFTLPNPAIPSEHVRSVLLNCSPWWWQTLQNNWTLHATFSAQDVFSAQHKKNLLSSRDEGWTRGPVAARWWDIVAIYLFSFFFCPQIKNKTMISFIKPKSNSEFVFWAVC